MALQFNATEAHLPQKIAIAVDFSFADETAINYAFNMGGKEAKYTLIHVVETVGAMMYGKQTDDHETTIDEKLLLEYKEMFQEKVSMSKPYLVLGSPTKYFQNWSIKANLIYSLWVRMAILDLKIYYWEPQSIICVIRFPFH